MISVTHLYSQISRVTVVIAFCLDKLLGRVNLPTDYSTLPDGQNIRAVLTHSKGKRPQRQKCSATVICIH